MAIGVKNIRPSVPIEIPYSEIFELHVWDRVDLLPGRCPAPGDKPVTPLLFEDIHPSIAVEIAKEQDAEWFSLFVEKTPLCLALRTVVPGFSGRKEEIIQSIPIKVTDGYLIGRIGRVEVVVIYH